MLWGRWVERAAGKERDAPDAVVEVAGDALADEIAGLVCLYKGLGGVYVWDVLEGIPVDCGGVSGGACWRGEAHPFAFCGRP